ncbi:MBL fold metallo-hydrolase [Amorphus orientalis]|uniref:Glyoxylase-like metal-dependent hydrolase (Beta-lactamase superfamily II) n=1 Tax=Amorphus orientalis TaxID=649198 RepID=A0AAE3VSE9_9HYPH|nr:MBL fold metallo-hydrolase [Amorphus orientalis]MDQ0317345.1 glyoxylase-like metal-dependent hydrolase (beta-lactamase superfamily II) [Amorphus orientalis]
MPALTHDRQFDPRYGEAVTVAPGVRRLTARNPSPMTFHGTNTYLIGDDPVAVIDPGPGFPEHIESLKQVLAGRTVSHILVTHTHADHSTAAAELAAATGAPTVGEGPHRAGRALREGETNALEASGDVAFRPDIAVAHGDRLEAGGRTLEVIATPGHTVNHLCFGLADERLLFSGDHVMVWSTTIVAPPDGVMADYMASLDVLLARDDRRYLPGHGGAVEDPGSYVEALRGHRQKREEAIVRALADGPRTIPEMVRAIYVALDPGLRKAAGLSLLAHLEDLVERGTVEAAPSVTFDATYRLASGA